MTSLTKLHAALAAVLFAAPAFAGKEVVDPKRAEAGAFVPLTTVSFRSSYTGESDFEHRDGAAGDAWFNGVSVAHRFPLALGWPRQDDAGWYFRLGAEYGRFDFDHAGDVALPHTLQNVNAVVAFEYLVRGETTLLLESAPGFYFESEAGAESFDAPTKLAAAFALGPRLFVVAGATYRGRFEKYPVLPVLGVVWLISDEWTLRLLAPAPRLIYRPSETWRFWVGGELGGGSYRTDDDAEREGKLRRAALSYSEYKVGAGFTWGDPDRFALEVGAGYALRRKFDYHRADEDFETDDGAPYVRVSLSAGF